MACHKIKVWYCDSSRLSGKIGFVVEFCCRNEYGILDKQIAWFRNYDDAKSFAQQKAVANGYNLDMCGKPGEVTKCEPKKKRRRGN